MARTDEQAIVEIILKGGQANATLKDIEKSASALRAQLKRLPSDSDEFVKKSAELRKVNERLNTIKRDIHGTGAAFNQISASLKNFFGVTALFTTAIAAFRDGIQTSREFGKSLANLSAITGASGADLKFFKDQALEMGKTVEGGAKAVVEAYKLIGSAKPELMSNKEALNQVTEAAILLSHASGLLLPEAATKLTDALNQFGAPASAAGKYVDVLAAAAKFGAAEVPEVTEALLKFGTAAKTSNIDIYESAAAIELLAEKGLKGADAGTALRNVFAKLAAADVLPEGATKLLQDAGVNIEKLKDNTIPLNERLTELSKIAGNASAITKVFGLENKIAGEIILTNLPRLEELTGQMKTTGVATEQASKNMDTFDQSIVNAGSAWDRFILSLSNGKLSGLMRTVVDGWTDTLNRFSEYLSGTANKNDDIISLRMVRGRGALTEDQAKRMVEYGFKVDFVNGKIQEQRRDILDLMKATDAYIGSLDGKNNYKKNRDRVAGFITGSMDKANVDYISGRISQEDYSATVTMLQAQLNRVNDIRKAALKQQTETQAANDAEAWKMRKEFEEKDRQEQKQKLDEKNRILKQKHEELLRELNTINNEAGAIGMEEWQKKYTKIIEDQQALEKKINSDKLLSETQRNEAIFNSRKLSSDKLLAIEKETADAIEKEKQDHNRAYLQLTDDAITAELAAIDAKYAKEIEYFKDNSEKLKSLYEAMNKEKEAVYAKTSTNTGEGSKGLSESQKRTISNAIDVYNQTEALAAQYEELKRQRLARENEAQQAQIDRDIARNQKLFDQKIITQETFNKRANELELRKTNQEKIYRQKAAADAKRTARYNTILSGAEAIANIWSRHAANPIYAGALTALATGVNIAKLAIIDEQQPPAYATGGFTPNNATLYNSSSGKNFIAGEAGAEWIAPNWMLENPITANTIALLENMRQGRMFAAGGSTGNTQSISAGKEGGSNSAGFADLANAINRLNSHLDGGLGVNYDLLTKTLASIDKSKQASAVN